jgi:hypothetical protein
VIKGMLQLQADGVAISRRTAVAYLSQEQGVTPLHLHGAAERRWLLGKQSDAPARMIRDSTQEPGVAFAQYSDMHWLIGFQP